MRDVLKRMGQIDILVNVAGVNCRKPSIEITEQDWDTVHNLNLKGLFFTSQAVGRYWLKTRRYAPEQNRGRERSSTLAVSPVRWGFGVLLRIQRARAEWRD